ncbi:MAG: nuclear transport factor 2 family protein [Gammaproteobacteria bacterium]
MTLEADNKRRAEAFFAALNRGDVPAIVDAYAEDGRCVTMGKTLISGTFSKAQIAAAAGGIFSAFPRGIRFTIHNLTAEGDRVAVEASSAGEHASGQLYTNEYHFLMRFRDGKLVELKEYMDTERVTAILCGGQRPAAAA